MVQIDNIQTCQGKSLAPLTGIMRVGAEPKVCSSAHSYISVSSFKIYAHLGMGGNSIKYFHARSNLEDEMRNWGISNIIY